MEFTLTDGTKMRGKSRIVNIAKVGYFDELEYEVWALFKQYAKHMNFELEDEIDWYTVKQIQDKIIEQFEDAGVYFNEITDPRLLTIFEKYNLDATDMNYILNDLVPKIKYWDNMKITDYMDFKESKGMLKICGVSAFAILPSGKIMLSYDFTNEPTDIKFFKADYNEKKEEIDIPLGNGSVKLEISKESGVPTVAMFYKEDGNYLDIVHAEISDTIDVKLWKDVWDECYTDTFSLELKEMKKALDS